MVQDGGDGAVISRLPAEWQSLFTQLKSSLEKGKLWFTEETSSVYGCRPMCHRLLASLVIHDPSIEDDKLIFKPRLLALSDRLQELFLQFLQHQSYIIPDTAIKEFVLAVISFTDGHSNIHHQLTQLFRETKNSEDLLPSATWTTIPDNDLPESKLDTPKADFALFGTQDSVIILDESDDEIEIVEPALKRQKLDENAVKLLETNEASLSSYDIETENTVRVDTEEDTDITPEIKDNNNGEETNRAIFIGNEGLICKLKERWQNCITDMEIEGLSEVSKLTVKEIEVFSKMVDFDSMSDDSIQLVCQHFCNISDSLSYSSAVCILTFVLGHRVLQLSQNASRKLSGAVTLVSQKFPKQTVDSVLVPCMSKCDISVAQSEILCKIVKESLNPLTRGYFLQKCIQNDFILTESKIPILQIVIDGNCELTSDTVSNLLYCLKEASVSMAKNLKFGKLLLAIVNKQSKWFNQEIKTKFASLLDKHGTFLKKSIQTALNKVKVL